MENDEKMEGNGPPSSPVQEKDDEINASSSPVFGNNGASGDLLSSTEGSNDNVRHLGQPTVTPVTIEQYEAKPVVQLVSQKNQSETIEAIVQVESQKDQSETIEPFARLEAQKDENEATGNSVSSAEPGASLNIFNSLKQNYGLGSDENWDLSTYPQPAEGALVPISTGQNDKSDMFVEEKIGFADKGVDQAGTSRPYDSLTDNEKICFLENKVCQLEQQAITSTVQNQCHKLAGQLALETMGNVSAKLILEQNKLSTHIDGLLTRNLFSDEDLEKLAVLIGQENDLVLQKYRAIEQVDSGRKRHIIQTTVRSADVSRTSHTEASLSSHDPNKYDQVEEMSKIVEPLKTCPIRFAEEKSTAPSDTLLESPPVSSKGIQLNTGDEDVDSAGEKSMSVCGSDVSTMAKSTIPVDPAVAKYQAKFAAMKTNQPWLKRTVEGRPTSNAGSTSADVVEVDEQVTIAVNPESPQDITNSLVEEPNWTIPIYPLGINGFAIPKREFIDPESKDYMEMDTVQLTETNLGGGGKNVGQYDIHPGEIRKYNSNTKLNIGCYLPIQEFDYCQQIFVPRAYKKTMRKSQRNACLDKVVRAVFNYLLVRLATKYRPEEAQTYADFQWSLNRCIFIMGKYGKSLKKQLFASISFPWLYEVFIYTYNIGIDIATGQKLDYLQKMLQECKNRCVNGNPLIKMNPSVRISNMPKYLVEGEWSQFHMTAEERADKQKEVDNFVENRDELLAEHVTAIKAIKLRQQLGDEQEIEGPVEKKAKLSSGGVVESKRISISGPSAKKTVHIKRTAPSVSSSKREEKKPETKESIVKGQVSELSLMQNPYFRGFGPMVGFNPMASSQMAVSGGDGSNVQTGTQAINPYFQNLPWMGMMNQGGMNEVIMGGVTYDLSKGGQIVSGKKEEKQNREQSPAESRGSRKVLQVSKKDKSHKAKVVKDESSSSCTDSD